MSDPDRELRSYRLVDLGCKVNQYETQLMAERLEAAGLRPAAPGEPADLCLVNSCAVTRTAAAKSARAVRALRRRNPEARLAVAGCMVSALGREETARRTGADVVMEQDEKLDLPGLELNASTMPEGISRFDGHARAFVKIQDGCDAFCSYCIVPHLRGRPRSRSIESIAAEARRLEAGGCRELVVSGVHLGAYGRDLEDQPSLAAAIGVVLQAAPRARVRVSSLDPGELGDDLLRLAASGPRFCPHLHLPLQSGDDGVLGAMGRRYTADGFLAAVGRVREVLKRPGISTDVMVGFPGESERAFENTLSICRRAGLTRLHVFRFSPREGTPAAKLPGHVSPAESRRRAGELIALGAELAADFAAGCVGSVAEVLAEEVLSDGRVAGYSERYVRTAFAPPAGEKPRLREVYRVDIESSEGPDIQGHISVTGKSSGRSLQQEAHIREAGSWLRVRLFTRVCGQGGHRL